MRSISSLASSESFMAENVFLQFIGSSSLIALKLECISAHIERAIALSSMIQASLCAEEISPLNTLKLPSNPRQ